MSFEGRTNYHPRYVQQWAGQAYTAIPILGMNPSFRFIGNARQEIRNTFYSGSIRMQAYVGAANTNWTYHLEDPLGNVNQIGGWAMVDSNGTLDERWYPPYSMGWISSRYYTRTSFNNSTGNTGNRYTLMEW